MKLFSRVFDRLRMLFIYVRLVRDPRRTELIFDAIEMASRDPVESVVRPIEEHVMDDDGFRRMYREKYEPRQPTLAELGAMPPGSFGRALHDHLRDNGLDLEIWPRVQVERPLDFLNARAYASHDLLHALFGYSTSVEDEMALQAVGSAQFHSPLSAFLISGGLLHLLSRDPLAAVRALGKVSDGYRRGREARFVLGMPLHEMLPLPLEEVRSACGVRVASA